MTAIVGAQQVHPPNAKKQICVPQQVRGTCRAFLQSHLHQRVASCSVQVRGGAPRVLLLDTMVYWYVEMSKTHLKSE